jgi:2-polyprenyl-3-methyl-5-hydroxy-6-metoxy-1,4-benzoquinol methylase
MAKRDPAENNIFLHKQKKLALTREGENPIYGVFTMTDGDAVSQIKVEVSYEAVWELLKNHKFQTVLDVGCGRGEHAEIFRFSGKDVTTIDPICDYADIKADFLSHPFDEKYDLVWTSHVLEHQRNVGLFIDRLLDVTEDNGLICITVPPEVSHYFILCHRTILRPITYSII